MIGLKDIQTPESEPSPNLSVSRLQGLLEPRCRMSPTQLDRAGNRFRQFLSELYQRGAELSQSEIDLLWLGYWRSYQDEKLEQRLEAARARLA